VMNLFKNVASGWACLKKYIYRGSLKGEERKMFFYHSIPSCLGCKERFQLLLAFDQNWLS
jgi:hypothetical protein